MCAESDESKVIINTDTNAKFPPELEKWGTRKKIKHAIKIPSSLGRFIVDSSCFFVSGPEVQKREGGGGDNILKDYMSRKTKQKNKSLLKEET